MGSATLAQQDDTNTDGVEQGEGAPLGASFSGGSSIASKPQEKHSTSHRKGMEKSILDDIMGDADDFRGLGDSDGESEGDPTSKGGLNTGGVEGEKAQRKIVEPKALSMAVGKNGLCVSSLKNKDTASGFIRHGEIVNRQSDETRNSPRVLQAARTRYFIIKSLNHHNIEKSIKKGIWATQAMNEPILNGAFESAEKVLLIFSVNMSGHFQGYAQMTSPIGQRRARVWNETTWGGIFSVEWIRLYDLPFQRTLHLKNPLNSFKPVKISRDCQELTPEIGEALCALIDEGADAEGRPKRKNAHLDEESFLRKKGCTGRMPWLSSDLYSNARTSPRDGSLMFPFGFLHSFVNEMYNAQAPMTIGGFSAGSRPPIQQHGLLGPDPPEMDIGGCKEIQGNRDQHGTAVVPFDEDFLNMTYEEYLQRVGNASSHYYEQGVSIWNRADEHC